MRFRASVVRLVAAAAALVVALTGAPSLAAGPATAPTWSQLTASQREILAPLEPEWDRLTVDRRKKWIGIAQRYPKMKPRAQANVQKRMNDWVRLSPQQRRAARENYRKIGKLAPEKRADLAQRWAEYQALPEEERNSLVAPPKPPAEPKRRARPATPPAAP